MVRLHKPVLRFEGRYSIAVFGLSVYVFTKDWKVIFVEVSIRLFLFVLQLHLAGVATSVDVFLTVGPCDLDPRTIRAVSRIKVSDLTDRPRPS